MPSCNLAEKYAEISPRISGITDSMIQIIYKTTNLL